SDCIKSLTVYNCTPTDAFFLNTNEGSTSVPAAIRLEYFKKSLRLNCVLEIMIDEVMLEFEVDIFSYLKESGASNTLRIVFLLEWPDFNIFKPDFVAMVLKRNMSLPCFTKIRHIFKLTALHQLIPCLGMHFSFHNFM